METVASPINTKREFTETLFIEEFCIFGDCRVRVSLEYECVNNEIMSSNEQ